MIIVVLSARSLPLRVWSHQLCSEALSSVTPDLVTPGDILVLQALNRSEPPPIPRKVDRSSSATSFSVFIQGSANHSIPIGRESCRGLVQSIFSSPSRRCDIRSFPKCIYMALRTTEAHENGIQRQPVNEAGDTLEL
jgi:hypothetical protein